MQLGFIQGVFRVYLGVRGDLCARVDADPAGELFLYRSQLKRSSVNPMRGVQSRPLP
jgi:hypothetical protein